MKTNTTTAESWLRSATASLTDAGITTARLDALILLEDATGKDRAWLLAHPEYELTDCTLRALADQYARRRKHEPLAYVRGHVAFYGRDFKVTHDVLVPRPETEAVVELAIEYAGSNCWQVADIGCGSGCIGLTLALELPTCSVELFDISPAALSVTRQNARSLGVAAGCYERDLMLNLPQAYNLVVTNLPYVPDSYAINQAARNEPTLALFAGSDGMDLYRRFWQQIGQLEQPPACVICEAFPDQHGTMAALARERGYTLQTTRGFAQGFGR